MSKKSDAEQPAKVKPTQEKPTRPRAVDPKTGRQLDEHRLPISGPARVAALAGRPDPRVDPKGWAEAGKAASQPATE